MFNVSAWKFVSHELSLIVAYALALPMGWNREREERSTGSTLSPCCHGRLWLRW